MNGLIKLIIFPGTMKEIIDLSSIILSAIGVSEKVYNLVKNHNEIENVIKTLTTGYCQPRDNEEELIQRKINKAVRSYTLFYLILNALTVLAVSIGDQLMDQSIGTTLPYGIYIPWDYSNNRFLFWTAYIYEVTSVAVSANASVGFDSLSIGLIIQINAKIEILKYRINALVRELESIDWTENGSENIKNMKIQQQAIADFVKYHLTIIELAKTINLLFNWVILLQYFISTTVLCASIYALTSSSQFMGFLFYLANMLMEIFIFCFAGNEITLTSKTISDAIYNSDWTKLNKSSRRSLLIIMNRANRPIIFVIGNIIELSYESFKGVIYHTDL
ncbi:odorant receptor 46a-like [Chelonus insularis]|uniref:odorant receptor 46a-like n=1 Tax=Chelonus insularis TaxID=460826 RepID=UPI0015894C35|nr:odorant receptor 46a-like [Chelonus insularis]